MLGWFSADAARALPAKAFQGLWLAGKLAGQELQGHEAATLGILGLVNHSHAAASQLLDDPLVGDGLADHE